MKRFISYKNFIFIVVTNNYAVCGMSLGTEASELPHDDSNSPLARLAGMASLSSAIKNLILFLY